METEPESWEAANPEARSQLFTAATDSEEGAKVEATWAAVQCWP